MILQKQLVFGLLSAVSLFILLAAACAPSLQQSPAAEAELAHEDILEEAGADTDPEPDPTQPESEQHSATDAIDLTDIDQMLESARAACGDSSFAAADSMMRRVSAFLMRNSVNSVGSDAETEPPPFQDYLADIISIYAELMPPSFSVPEEISVMIFKQHILESLLDSLQVSPQDSIFLHRLSSKRGVLYDVPMVWNDRVRRALMFYMRTRNGVFDRWLHRAGYYLPMMTQMFADSGLPRDLAHLPIIESGFNPNAYSRAHASGIWQFIPSTGRAYGMRQNYWIDERRDPIRATEGAIMYLRKLYGDFGDWHIALASYNCGENGMARAIKRADGLHDYWQLTLPKETMNYIPLFLGAVLIAKNPDVFNFAIQDSVIFDPDTVFVHDCIELNTIAEGIGLPLDTLERKNPHILHWATPPDMRDVRLYLPKGYGDKFREFYANLPDDKKTKFYRYKVQNGDNLLHIARNFRVPVEALRELNGMKTNTIAAGKYLIIPIPIGKDVPASLAKHLNTTDRKQQKELAKERARNAPPPMGSAPGRGRTIAASGSMDPPSSSSSAPSRRASDSREGKKITYKVRTGETLQTIANTFGVTVANLMEWNYLANARSLKAEQTLVIYQHEKDTSPSAAKISGTPTEHSGKHLVKQGETLYGISQATGVSVSELARVNGLNPRRPLIFPGDVLVYTPPTGRAASSQTSASGTTNTGNELAAVVQISAPTPAAAQPARAQQASGPVVIYTVKPGDNLWRIAYNFGVTVETIRNENNLDANSVIMPGDILRITRGGTQ
ncbi:MAG: LysM peptidoglycan-binding domain-containing protein [Chitinispirillia bacterium]|nr:LysM peptidoglycan-binding domain-containing protein [Chitinispirillia bacterium]MCL2241937.1 LysM peptidoglycan-binding domain-containing protein [Chitinispirillia bacterium]